MYIYIYHLTQRAVRELVEGLRLARQPERLVVWAQVEHESNVQSISSYTITLTTQFWWGGQTGMARSAVWSRWLS